MAAAIIPDGLFSHGMKGLEQTCSSMWDGYDDIVLVSIIKELILNLIHDNNVMRREDEGTLKSLLQVATWVKIKECFQNVFHGLLLLVASERSHDEEQNN